MISYTKPHLEHGYANQFLRIDVTQAVVEVKPLDPTIRDFFIGGRGLGLYLLHRSVTSRTKAFDPENPLILSPGPLGGIPHFPGTSKCMAISLSPLTHIPGVSNFGGHFGAYLKYAGFDVLEIMGKSEKPLMIVIDGFKNRITLEQAPEGAEVFGLEKVIVEQFRGRGYGKKDIVFLTTGLGAARTTYGCINSHYFDPAKQVNGTRGIFRTKQAGRTGLGSVMYDKNVRAVVVLADYPKGENPYGAQDWDRVKKAGARLHQVVKENDPQSLQMYRKGSAGLINFMNQETFQSLPVNNYQLGSDPRAGQIDGSTYAERLFVHKGMDGCFPGCNLRCTKGGPVTLTSGGHRERVWVDGPEYETAAAFGSNLGIWNPEFIMEANWHCDNYGIDTITVAVIMAFIMECFQRGYLTKEDTGGIELHWGDEATAMDFIHQVARPESELAAVAGRGMQEMVQWVADKYAQRTGLPAPLQELAQFAMQAKGLPFSLYRTHRSLSMQGSYAAASDIGAHHAAAWLIKVDLLGAFPTFADKARALITYPRVRLGNDNLGLCKLPWVDVFNPDSKLRENTDIYINPASQEIYAELYNGMLGTELTWEQIFEQTDRDINLQRVMNTLVFDKTPGDYDWLPDRAIGPIDDDLYLAEKGYNDQEVARYLEKPVEDVGDLNTAEKREILMSHRKKELRQLIDRYYQERGWTPKGIPTPETLKRIGLWDYLTAEAREKISEVTGG
jgi:aldehyde:ferredoxin oxidoreductase